MMRKLPARDWFWPLLGTESRLVQTYMEASGIVPDWAPIAITWERPDGTWTLSDEAIETHHTKGGAVLWVSRAGVSRVTTKDGESAVSGGGGGGAGGGYVSTQGPDGAWSITPARAAEIHAAGGVILWVTADGGAYPTAEHGAIPGDIVNGVPLGGSLVTVQVPGAAAPTKTDADGTANDTITLTRVPGVVWRVGNDGAATLHDAASFGAGQTKTVPWTSGGNAEVAAMPAPGYVISGVAAWTLTFTSTSATTTVQVPAASAPTATDAAGTGTDAVVLTSVTGVIWTVDGTQHPSSGFTGTKNVPYAKGTATTVTATAAPGYTLTGTTSWPLTFTDVPAASGWVQIGELHFNEPDRVQPASQVVPYGGVTLATEKGSASIAGNRLVLVPGEDKQIAMRTTATTQTAARYAVEWETTGRPEGWNRNYVWVANGIGDPFGIVYTNGGAQFCQSGNYSYGTIGDNELKTPALPIPDAATATHKVRMEVDTVAKNVAVYYNGAPVATFPVTGSVTNQPRLTLRQGAYTSTGSLYDNLRIYNWVA